MATPLSTAARIRMGLVWQSASVIAQALTQIAVLGVLARLVPPEAFGLIAIAGVVVALAELASEGGAGAALVQYKGEVTPGLANAARVISFGIGGVLFTSLYFSAPFIERFFDAPGLHQILLVLSTTFIITGFGRVSAALMQRNMQFSVLMKVSLAAQLIGYAAPGIILAILGFGVWALVGAIVGQALIRSLLLCAVGTRSFGFRTDRHSLREIGAFGLGMTKIKFWNYVMLQGDRFLIGREIGALALGHYHIASQLARMPVLYVGNVIDSVFFPVMSRLQETPRELENIYLQLVTYSVVGLFGLGAFLAVNGRLFIVVVLGETWLPALLIFQIYCLGAGFRTLARIGDASNRALGQVYPAAMRKMFASLLFLISIWFAIPFGIVAVTCVVVINQACAAILVSSLAWQGIGIASWKIRQTLFKVTGISIIIGSMNVLLFYSIETDALSTIEGLAVSSFANAGLAFIFLKPLVRIWRIAR